MKTIAISIDDPTLTALDRLVGTGPEGVRNRRGGKRTGNRSEVVRLALQEFIARRAKLAREQRERGILAANRERLAREAAALVAEQAKP
jgi:Arc/MetJ-type ribon-helix-helix transcriptional regulator